MTIDASESGRCGTGGRTALTIVLVDQRKCASHATLQHLLYGVVSDGCASFRLCGPPLLWGLYYEYSIPQGRVGSHPPDGR